MPGNGTGVLTQNTAPVGRAAASTPRVTIVMAAHNAAEFLRQAIESILSQSFRDFELVVVDDCSTDASPSVLRAFEDPRIRVITHRTNFGAAISRNDALEAARGEYVAIMDADDISLPDRLERQVAYLDTHLEVGLVGCAIFDNIDTDGSVLYTSYLPEENEALQAELVERWCFLHPSIMFRRQLIQRVGGYRPEFEVAEDHDFILRVLEHAHAHNISERLVAYRINPRGLSVVGHEYINEMGCVAMGLAQRRRRGLDENFPDAVRVLHELRRRRAESRGRSARKAWADSFYAANRFYGFGCKELYLGHARQARVCFLRSLKTNPLFVKSWICLFLSWVPFAARYTKFLFPASRRFHEEQPGRAAANRSLNSDSLHPR